MDLFITVLFALIVPLLACQVDTSRKNVSCAEIKTSDGFKYKYDYPAGGDIFVYHNKTKIGSWENGNQPKLLTDVIRLDNNSVITEKCRDLQIQVLKYEDKLVIEYWVCFTVAVTDPVTPGSYIDDSQLSTMKTEIQTPPSHDYNRKLSMSVGAVVAVVAVVAIVVIFLFCCYMSWKKKTKEQQKATTCSEYFRYLRTRYTIKKQIPTTEESSGTGETRQLRGSEIQAASATTECQQNGISLAECASATDPCGSGDNGAEQDSSHGSMHVVSIHPQSNDLDHKLRNEEIQSTSNEDLNTPGVDRASPHGDMNSVRNMRDDPGGNKGYVGVDIPDSDMIAEAEPLVNKSGYGQDPVGRSFATPGTDVESQPRVKNFGNY